MRTRLEERRAQLRLAGGMDTPCLEFPLNGRIAPCVPVCSANFFTEMFGWSDSVLFGTRADNNDSVAPSQWCHVFACVAIPHGALFWFRRLKFTHATVLTLTIRNCCRKFRVGACSHRVVCARCVFVARCMRRAVAMGASHVWEICFSYMDIWYSECYVIVLGVAFFVQGVCVV